MSNLKKFYKNKKIFITGHTGFKGSWLSSILIEFGSKVMGYSIKDNRVKFKYRYCPVSFTQAETLKSITTLY